jgi:hypothetical protein
MGEQPIRLITPESLRTGLNEIRRRRRLHWIVFLTFLPACAVLIRLFDSSPLSWLILAWPVAFIGTAQYAFSSLCPLCGDQFASRPGDWHNPWTQRCLHCGLRLRSTDPELREALQPHGDSAA